MTAVRAVLRIGLAAGAALALAIGILQVWQHRRHEAEDRRLAVSEVADLLRLRVEGAMQRRMLLTEGLAAFVAATPEVQARAFSSFVAPLMRDGIAAAMVMPGHGIDALLAATPEQAALGRKLALDPVEWRLIGQAAGDGQAVISDPLRIDGRNLIGAYDPIFLGGEDGVLHYWGMALGLFDLDRLQSEIEAVLPRPAPRYAIRNLYRDDAAPGMVAGERALAGRGDATRIARFPGATWEISVAAASGPGGLADAALAGAPAGMMALLLIGFFILASRGGSTLRALPAVADEPPAPSAPPEEGGAERRSLELEDQRILLRSTLESLDEGVAVFDDQGLLILWNSRFPALLDIDPICLEQGIGLRALLAVQGERGILRPEDIALTTGQGQLGRTRATLGRRVARSGTVVRVDVCWAPGDRTVVTLANETDTVRSAQVLAASEQLLRRVLEISPIAIAVLDRRGRPLFYNERLREMFGLSHGEMAGYVGATAFENPAEMETVLIALRDNGSVGPREMRIRRPDGAMLWVSLAAQNVTFDGQKATICHLLDITALKDAGANTWDIGELGDVLALARVRAGEAMRPNEVEPADRAAHTIAR